MSEKFSVEDILNEVKQMSGDTYLSGKTSYVKPQQKSDIQQNEAQVEPTSVENEQAQTDFAKPDVEEKPKGFNLSQMSREEFFSMLEASSTPKADNSEIVDGFKVIKDFSDNNKKSESQPDLPEMEKIGASVENPVENVKTQDKKDENLEKTMVFDRNELKNAIENQQAEKEVESVTESEKDDLDKDFVRITPKREHKPEHLLSVDEIKSGEIGTKPSFRFNEKIVDLTSKKDKKEETADKFEQFKPAEVIEEIPEETEITTEPITERTEADEPVTQSVSADELNADNLFEALSKKYTQNQVEKAEPDKLQNEVTKEDEEVVEIPMTSDISFEKDEPMPLDEPVKSTSDNRFSRKVSRRIEERDFDYSADDDENKDDVVDDYTSIDDEEDVRSDLDISLKKASKRLTFTVISFIFGLIINVLPIVDADFIGFISPNDNLTGFLIANAIVLLAVVLINISSILRGLWSLVRLKPDADSPLAIASLFVCACSVVSLVPEFSAIAGKLPFYTAALQFGYILTLMGKKSMVLRIKQNFRLVANTAVKQSCFIADERLSEMLENEDFIGTPYVAASKSVVNLHNYLKNSYCEDPSDNIARIFAPISLVAAVVTLIFTYFVSKDIVSALFYATAVSLAATPVSAMLSVHSPLKKAAMKFRQKDGLISGYEAVNEFADVDCVAINAEDLFPAGSVEMKTLRAIGDIAIEDVILKSAALTIAAGGPLADVFYKIIDGRRKMLSPVSDIIYEDGLGITGKIDGKTVRVGNREFIDSYGIYGLSDIELEEKAENSGCFIVYTAIEDEVCGMFVLKYKSIDPDVEDAVYDLVSNGITIAVKSNDPNITASLIAEIFEIPEEYVTVMEAHTAEYYDEVTRPAKNGNSIISFGGSSTVFASLIVACKKLKTKISVAVLLQAILTIVGFGLCMFTAVSGKGFENINTLNIIVYEFIVAVISVFVPAIIKRIK